MGMCALFKGRTTVVSLLLVAVVAVMAVGGLTPHAAFADEQSLAAGTIDLQAGDEAQESGEAQGSDQAGEEFVPMFRMYNAYTGEHLYTANQDERAALVPLGWVYEGVGWQAPASGNPVYRLYNPNTGLHFYTLGKDEHDSLVKLGWASEGIGWYSCSQDDQAAIAVYRQYNPVEGGHNYTTDADEASALVELGWADEGAAWYGRVADESYEDAMEPGTGLYNTQVEGQEVSYAPTYRLYHPAIGDHLFTIDKEERNKTASRIWHYEGVSWNSASAGIPVYRLANPYTGGHMFTMSPAESGMLLHAGWKSEGIRFYSCPQGDADRVEVYRLYNPYTSDHFFTKDESERDGLVKAGWKDEGVAWYVHDCDPDYQDDLEEWTPWISGDADLDVQLEIILYSRNTLRSAFDYVTTAFGYIGGDRFFGGPRYLDDDKTISFAKEMLANGGGNCYRYASLFSWLARGLGYKTMVVSGWVPSISSGEAPHGWVEIEIDGRTYVSDPDLEHEIGGKNWYLFTYDDAPTNYGSW